MTDPVSATPSIIPLPENSELGLPVGSGPSAASGAGPVAVRTRGLTKRYGSLCAVQGLDIAVPAGSVFGLIGPNGAGKTTAFAILASVLRPTSGTAEVAGFDPATDPVAVRRHLGYMPDVLGVYDNLKVVEYLEFFASAYRIPANRWPGLVDGLLELVGLEVRRDAMVDSLSRGMKQRLALARALVHDPEVLILDEPASGLDPRARVELRNLVTELAAMGKTVVISSHILSELQEMCTHVAIIEAGRLRASGTPREIAQRLSAGRTVVVRLAGGAEQRFQVEGDDAQAALLARLIGEGQRVLEFREEGGGLEDLFMKVTEGTVQ
ncbi:MAG: ABC transporter ATP-binding protein [Acidimicrobiales bacterium]